MKLTQLNILNLYSISSMNFIVTPQALLRQKFVTPHVQYVTSSLRHMFVISQVRYATSSLTPQVRRPTRRRATLVLVLVIVAWELRMRPPPSVIRPGATVNILCQADSNTPLAACGFQVSHVGYYDASMGAETPSQTTPYYTLQYYGTGLRRGQCGVRLTATEVQRTLNVGCRGRTQRGGWKYDFMTFIIRETDTLPFTVEPRHQVMLPGQTVSVLFRLDEPLTSCHVKPASQNRFVNFDNGANSVATTHFKYHGDGLANGDCGITVFDVTEEDNEWIIFDVKTGDGKTAYTTSLFPVAKPPTDSPELSLSKTNYVDGDMLEAECTVAESRPPANITWYIGRDVIGGNSVEELPDSRWRWKIDPEKRRQKIRIPVTTLDDGKELRCVADHVGMENTLQASKRIQVARAHTTDEETVAPECGKRNSRPSLVAGGKDADDGEFPWHAGLYMALRNGTYTQVCGGTLIKPNVVITAAHCVYDERVSKVKDKSAYRVVLGKLLRDWYADMANTGVQRREVASIDVPRNYRGRRLDYRYDIAVLKLSVHVVITHSVNIACVHWEDTANSVPPLTGDLGVVAGWGVTSTGKMAADVLQWVDLPFADSDTCHNATPLQTQKYLTHDKFCAGYVERNTSVCQGDSGGGILFQDKTTKRYFLRGIVSTNLVRDVDTTRCNAQLFTTFTSMVDYMKWVKTIVS